ncbi:MAG TPA: oligoribonuclease [Candidatus Saccharimonadales bacterium]|nr:oligoribonuclease [Candidatus Saccharimonadales bacterium]
MIAKHDRPTKLLWLDLEMTGLNPQRDAMLEVAAEVTDFDLHTVVSYEAVIHQPEAVLARSDAWARTQHTASGLLERVRSAGRSEQSVAAELAALISTQFGDEPAVLAGNSVHQDRSFIRQHWPEVEQLLHYRMLDVSSLKVYMQGKYGVEFAKKETHRAPDDIRESIAEWQYCLAWLAEHRA